ncbi:MAG: tetratricopeptide repeat protein, partial [Rhizobiaceae bacterium]
MPAKKRVQALVSLYRKGRFKEVISRGTRMVKQSPDAVFVLNLVGSAHAGLCHPETAAALFKKATKLAPSYSNAHHNLGLAHMQMQNPAEAIVSFKIAISLEPNNIEFNNSLGTAFVANKEPEKAVEVFHTAVQRNPENSTLQKNLGQAYLVLGKPKEALAPFRAIAKANPDDLGMLISLAELLTKLNMPSDSMECIKAAARIAPENPNVYLTLGRFWEKQEDFEKAIQAYDRPLTFDEGNTEVESTRAYALIAHGEPKRAIEGYERILNIWPDDNEARHFLSALKGEITETAPSEYVAGLFDSYAATFEASLVETLEYQTPQKLAAFLIANSPIGQRFSTTLDLGCGTGLFGQA